MTTIIGIKINERAEDAMKLQAILTHYGCYIQTRIGLHPIGEYKCSNFGVVLIEVVKNVNEIYDNLNRYWEIQTMKF